MEPFKKSPVSASKAGLDYKEIKSHSSLLSNERLAILFYTLDFESINLNSYYSQEHLMKTKSITFQIYKNIRALIRNNAHVRAALNLDTKVEGVYSIDLAFNLVEEMIQYCTFNGFTYKRCYAIAQQLNFIEVNLRDVLQYFQYFFRAEFKQKPDVMVATEKYKQMADRLTVEKLRSIIGKNNKIDFDLIEESLKDDGEDPDDIKVIEVNEDEE